MHSAIPAWHPEAGKAWGTRSRSPTAYLSDTPAKLMGGHSA
jgi:hypothetical protein